MILLKKRMELGLALVAVPAGSVVKQWKDEIEKFSDLSVAVVAGLPKAKRMEIYRNSNSFDVILISHALVRNDDMLLDKLGASLFLLDEASCIKNHAPKLSKVVKRLVRKISRFGALSATPVQNDLTDIHSIFEGVDRSVLGAYTSFKDRYCVEELQFFRVRTPFGIFMKHPTYTLKDGEAVIGSVTKIVGSKNVQELKEKIEPYFLRRRVEDVSIELPSVVVRDTYLDLHREQKKLYNEIKSATCALLKDGNYFEVKKNMHTLQQCVDGTGSLPDVDEDISVKLDYIEGLLKGDLCGEKVIIFSFYRKTVELLASRCQKLGLKCISIMGLIEKSVRNNNIESFRNDPDVNICIGTTAMEMGLNLQVAGFLICVDRLANPTRMEQLVGRLRRIGSPHKVIVLMNLLTNGTMEKQLYKRLSQKQALVDYMFDESSDLFEQLNPDDLAKILSE